MDTVHHHLIPWVAVVRAGRPHELGTWCTYAGGYSVTERATERATETETETEAETEAEAEAERGRKGEEEGDTDRDRQRQTRRERDKLIFPGVGTLARTLRRRPSRAR